MWGMCVRVHRHICAYMCGGHKSALRVFRMLSALYLEIGSLTDLELANMTRLAGQ